MTVRTPDPNPGWLSDQELDEIRRRLPLLYVEAVPVRVDGLGQVTEVGILLRVSPQGSMTRTIVSGRVMYGETLRDALFRHLEKDLGPMAFPQLPTSPVPFSVAENGIGLVGSCGNAIGPRSFSRCRKSASRSVSPYMTRPDTMVRVIDPLGETRSRTPTSVTCPSPSTRTG